MSALSEASSAKKVISDIVNKLIKENEIVRSAIKAKKAIVSNAEKISQGLVGVKFPMDDTEITLPFNSRMGEEDLAVGKVVSVWYTQTIQNGIVMQNGTWTL